MKKTAFTFLVLFGLAISHTSCVKEYICQCKIESKGSPGMPSTEVNEYIIKDKKETAKSLCEKASHTYTDPESGITTTETCKIF